MFKNLWSLLRQDSYISHLREELETVRREKNELQETLFKTLRIHLIPNNLQEMQSSPKSEPISIPRRGLRSMLNEMQKKSLDEATRKRIDEEESKINESNQELITSEKEF